MNKVLIVKDVIIALNEKIRENEKAGNSTFFDQHLADDLIFRRADGSLASKQEFIAGLQGRAWRVLENIDLQVNFDEKHPNYAVVSLTVDFDFTVKADGAVKKGRAKNIRFFRWEHGVWTVYAWYNETVAA